MRDDIGRAGEEKMEAPEAYVAPALEVLGSVEELTRGPVVGDGDVPTGVISF
jgi:hypothetical protein